MFELTRLPLGSRRCGRISCKLFGKIGQSFFLTRRTKNEEISTPGGYACHGLRFSVCRTASAQRIPFAHSEAQAESQQGPASQATVSQRNEVVGSLEE